uniref:Uncharacterized protein n=1 Tax=Cacopsylla melanoneura TaxID=428564 RepID=A0A8D8UTY2_9HEMI
MKEINKSDVNDEARSSKINEPPTGKTHKGTPKIKCGVCQTLRIASCNPQMCKKCFKYCLMIQDNKLPVSCRKDESCLKFSSNKFCELHKYQKCLELMKDGEGNGSGQNNYGGNSSDEVNNLGEGCASNEQPTLIVTNLEDDTSHEQATQVTNLEADTSHEQPIQVTNVEDDTSHKQPTQVTNIEEDTSNKQATQVTNARDNEEEHNNGTTEVRSNRLSGKKHQDSNIVTGKTIQGRRRSSGAKPQDTSFETSMKEISTIMMVSIEWTWRLFIGNQQREYNPQERIFPTYSTNILE